LHIQIAGQEGAATRLARGEMAAEGVSHILDHGAEGVGARSCHPVEEQCRDSQRDEQDRHSFGKKTEIGS